MTNREFYKDQILDIVCKGSTFGFDKRTNKPCSCDRICSSGNCLFYSQSENCDDRLEQWCNSEYIEPCQFKKGELVEVSADGEHWHLRYFSHISSNIECKYAVYPIGLKSGNNTLTWKYCRKYGTLGGLVKEDVDTNVPIRDELEVMTYKKALKDFKTLCEINEHYGNGDNVKLFQTAISAIEKQIP